MCGGALQNCQMRVLKNFANRGRGRGLIDKEKVVVIEHCCGLEGLDEMKSNKVVAGEELAFAA